MTALRRIAVVSILIGSCGLGITDPDPRPYSCTPYAPDTVTVRWPESLTLVLGAADEVTVDRGVEDGCSYQAIDIPGLGFTIGDSSVARTVWFGSHGVTVVPSSPGNTWVRIEADDFVDSIPVSVPDTFALAPVSALAAGGPTTCAVEEAGRVLCWGGDYSLLLGSADDPAVGTCHGVPCSPMPKPIGRDADEVFLGADQACFFDAGGMTCRRWDGVEFSSNPVLVDVTISPGHKCGLSRAGEAYCWGRNDAGQLGTGISGRDAGSPSEVQGLITWASLDATERSTCGITASGQLYCWGALPNDVPGTGSCEIAPGVKGSEPTFAPCASEPLRIFLGEGLGADTLLSQVAGRCVLTTEGGALCAPEGTTRFTRVADPGSFVTIRAGVDHHCGLASDGTARCWGRNEFGQLGVGDTSRRDLPAIVDGGHLFSELALGDVHSCGLTLAGVVWCWGGNDVGQASGSILETPLVPRKVRGQSGT